MVSDTDRTAGTEPRPCPAPEEGSRAPSVGSEARYQTLFDVYPDGVIVMDDRSVVLAVNPAVERLLGYGPAELVGRPLSVIIPERLREAHRLGVERYLTTGRRNIPWSGVELSALDRRGREIPVQIAFGEYLEDGRHVFAGFVRDLTERKRAEARRSAEHAVTRVLAGAPSPEEAAPRLLEAVCGALGWDLGALWQVDRDAGVLRLAGSHEPPPVSLLRFREAMAAMTFARGQGLPGRVWESGRAAWIPEIGQDPNFPRMRLAAEAGLQAAFGVPVTVGSDIVGVMEFLTREVREPDLALLQSMETIGAEIGQFFERRRAEAERDRALEEALHARTRAEAAALELEESHAGLEHAHGDLQRTSTALRESEERFRILAETIQEVLYVTSVDPFQIEYLSPAYERIWGRSARELVRNPHAYIDAIHPEDREPAREALHRQLRGEETSTEYRIVRPDGETRWILDRAFPVRDASGRVGRITGSAADITARKRAEEAQRFLADASAVFAESLEPDRLLGRLAELAVPRLGDWCAIYAANGSLSDTLAVAHLDPARAWLVRELTERYPIRVGERSGAGRTLATGEPQLYPEMPDELLERRARDAAELELLRRLGLRSYLCVPFRAGGRQHALAIAMSESGRRLGPGDLRLAQDLARRAALALENAHLFQEGQQARLAAERLQRVTAAVSEAVTLEQIGEAVMHHGIRAFGGDCGVLALVTDAGDQLRIVASTGYPAEACMGPERYWPLSARIPIAEAARTGATVVVPSPEAWRQRYGGGSSRSSTAAWVAIPVRYGPGQAEGGALLWTQTAPTDFSPEQIASMETVARLCGQALERARLYEAERKARTDAEEANRAKTEFLSAMSHELRTPLNAIGGYVDLMELGIRGPVSEQQRADLARIRVAQTALLSLINDILNFARIEAGRIEYRSEVVPVGPLLDELASLVGPQVAAREIRYHCSPGGEGLAMRGDPERIRQVALNLLSNAVKFTDRGGEIRLSAEGVGRRVVIRVADTGRGIAPDRLDDIFDPFVQLNRREVAESQQGVGLGLAISRELAHAMGGEITAESELGVGSTFTLTLPRADGPEADAG